MFETKNLSINARIRARASKIASSIFEVDHRDYGGPCLDGLQSPNEDGLRLRVNGRHNSSPFRTLRIH
jgi:hypothetical protein